MIFSNFFITAPHSVVLAILILSFLDPVSAQETRIERLARRLEPQLSGKAERLLSYVEAYRHEFGNDPRLFHWEIDAVAKSNGKVRLDGFLEITEMWKGLIDYLGLLGFEVEDHIKLLPSENLKDKKFGIIQVSNSLSYDRPAGKKSVVSDCLMGDRVYLLREISGHFLVHGSDGYLGYVLASDIKRMDEKAFQQYLSGPRIRITTEYRISNTVLPLGAHLKWIETEKDRISVELPTGELVMIPKSICKIIDSASPYIDVIIDNAHEFMGTKYFWGGKTTAGIDCSGLVQVSFSTVGINLPRDSNQQFLNGKLTGTRWSRTGMRRGDTLYFLGNYGRIRHVAIYLGDDRYIQAEMPKVSVRSLNPEHEDFDAKRAKSFVFAKRLFD